jgi:hypothetical protein
MNHKGTENTEDFNLKPFDSLRSPCLHGEVLWFVFLVPAWLG